MLVLCDSSSDCAGALAYHRDRGHGHVGCGRTVDLWNDYQLYHVLPGGAGVLGLGRDGFGNMGMGMGNGEPNEQGQRCTSGNNVKIVCTSTYLPYPYLFLGILCVSTGTMVFGRFPRFHFLRGEFVINKVVSIHALSQCRSLR